MKPLRVLIADDEPPARRRLRRLLLEIGGVAVVGEAGDAPATAAAIRLHRPDVVLLDIQMPKMSGYDLVRELRRYERAPRPLLIAVSAWGQESDKLASKQAGFDHHLTKPVDPEALLRLVGAQGP
jgi:two-component system CheB/CheR fusion protein